MEYEVEKEDEYVTVRYMGRNIRLKQRTQEEWYDHWDKMRLAKWEGEMRVLKEIGELKMKYLYRK